MKAADIKEIEAMTGAKVVAATKETSSFNSDFVLLDDNGTIRQAFTVRGINGKMCVDVFAAKYDTIAAALAYLNMSDEELAQNIEYINPENNTPATMNANGTKSANISHAAKLFNRIDAMNERGAWNKGVKVYALTLLNWYIDEASESPLTLDTMLNGANDWYHYSRSGCGVAQCYNDRIAETLCSPSELKRCKGGAKNPNSCEDWCDVEGRALVQAWQLINTAEMLVSANM